MLYIYLTRHGETRWNKENRLQGWKDSELTESGIENAIALGERLSQTDFQAIYSSPSGRAVQTAKLVRSNRPIPIILEEDLKEIYLGEWEGKTQTDMEEKDQREFYHFWNAPHLYNSQLHRGESLINLKLRVEKALGKIIAANTEGNVMIVTHAVAIRTLFTYFRNTTFENLWDPPFIHGTSLTVIRWDGKTFQLEMIGDTSHIK